MTQQVISLNTANSSELPYLIFPELNIKLLIDSGSTKSFINPELAFKCFPNCIRNDPFIVSTVFQKSAHQYSAEIPASKIFELPKQTNLKFYLFKFHNVFDGLIGIDNLKILQANVNFDKGYLITPYTKIKLCFHETRTELNCITISPRCEQLIQIPTSIRNGEIIIPYQKIHNCEIPECLTIAKNGKALTSILNNTCEPITLDFSEPLVVEEFCMKDLENITLNNFDDTPKNPQLNLPLLRTDHLNEEEKSVILDLCSKFSDIFYQDGTPLTFTSRVKHHIRTTDEVPIYTKTYRYPFVHKKEVETQINKMLSQNIIRQSNSPWSSPIWVVPKKLDASGVQKWRVVIDYRKLNLKSLDDKYPLPNITDLLDKLGKCQYFTTLDLASGFHQIEMNESDIQKTAFSTENGHYEFLRMPFGLKNAPATFQRVMDNILRGITNEKCAVYLDDIIIYSSSLQEHIVKLTEVFKRLRESNFKIQIDKSEFLKKEVAYLGHVVTPDGVKPNPDKIKAIKHYPIPKTTKEIKGFLGLLGYYRRFINNFSKITKPLTKCLKKGATIEHNEEFVSCFERCKTLLINEPILQYPDFSKPFNLTCDASNVALGCVLSQGPIGKDLPIAYASRTLNESEQNYSTIEKECLCLVWSTKYFRPYLFGRKFNIITDHKPLQWLFSLKDPASKLVRWRIKLQEFDYQIIYKKGKLNTNADALSRIELHTKETKGFDLGEYANQVTQNLDNDTDNIINVGEYSNQIVQAPDNENTLNNDNTDQISTQVHADDDPPEIPADDDATVHSNQEQNLTAEVPILEIPVNYGANQIVIREVLHSPAKTKTHILFEKKRRFAVQISTNNFEQDIMDFIKAFIVPEKSYHLYFETPDTYERFCEVIRKNFKWPSIKFKRCLTKLLDVTNKDDIFEIIKNYHESKSNHRGIEETEQKIKTKYYWPNLKNSIQTYINDCEICQISKYERNPVKIKMNVTPTATRPFEIIHLDTYTLEQTKFLTIIDSFSKYAQAYPIKSLSSTEIVDNLLFYFSHHKIPKQIIVDNGTEFKNSVVTELLQLHKIQIHFCSPHHPQSNGVVERLHSTLAEHIRLLNNQNFSKTPISQKMIYAILAYNNSLHSATKIKPTDVINGHITEDNPFDINIEQVLLSDYINDHKDKTKILYSKINEKLVNSKELVINKINEKREDPEIFEPDKTAYVKKHIRQKHADKFSQPTKLLSVNKERKTAKTQSHEKIHLSNLKRPLRNRYSFAN